MNEVFMWVLYGIGCFILGWVCAESLSQCRISLHADELDRLRDANARLRALARLKAYREIYEDGKEHE